jgi:hypothetical protein
MREFDSLEAKKEISQAPSPLAVQLTAIRGVVRRTPEGVPKQHAELLGGMIKNRVPGDFIKNQAALMAGQPLPVTSCIADHSPHIWALIQEARQRHQGGIR